MISTWPLARRAATVLGTPIENADPAALSVAASQHVGGLLLLGSFPAGSELRSRLSQAVSAAGTPAPLVMVDQEGGGVQRLGADDVTQLPWPQDIAKTMTPAQVRSATTRLGQEMKALGVNVDLAPVLDLDDRPGPSASNPDGRRSFSIDPATAGSYGVAFMQGLQAGGVLSVLKHFPGLGGANANTDYSPAATRPLATLQQRDMAPFRSAIAAGARAVLVANATVPGLTTEPASLSPQVITGLLRQDLHFQGLIMTDSLTAGAIQGAGFSVPAAVVASLKAGSDMTLFGSTLTSADTAQLQSTRLSQSITQIVQAIETAVDQGSLPVSRLDDAVTHVVAASGTNLCAGH